MFRRVARVVLNVDSSVYYFISGVLVSLSVSALFSAFGTVPRPANFWSLLVTCGSSGIASFALWSLAGTLDRIRRLAVDRRFETKISEGTLLADAADEYWGGVLVRVGVTALFSIASIAALTLGQLV